MLKTLVIIAGALTLAVVGHAFAVSDGPEVSDAVRKDCPGQLECPLTGELICRDRCPVNDPDRPDCPGRIECPDTGALVCADRCTAEPRPEQTAEPTTTPSCCWND